MARFRSAVVPWDSAVTSEMQGGCAARTLAGSVEKAEGGSSGAPAANIQAYGGRKGWRRGVSSGVDLPRGVRGRARETCAIFHHYADTMVGLAGSYVLLFLLALLPTSPLIFLPSLLVRRVVSVLDPRSSHTRTHARVAVFTSCSTPCFCLSIFVLSFPLNTHLKLFLTFFLLLVITSTYLAYTRFAYIFSLERC